MIFRLNDDPDWSDLCEMSLLSSRLFVARLCRIHRPARKSHWQFRLFFESLLHSCCLLRLKQSLCTSYRWWMRICTVEWRSKLRSVIGRRERSCTPEGGDFGCRFFEKLCFGVYRCNLWWGLRNRRFGECQDWILGKYLCIFQQKHHQIKCIHDNIAMDLRFCRQKCDGTGIARILDPSRTL